MTGIYGVNLTGLKRQPTFDEVIGIKNFKPKYPDRRNKFLRNSPMMTQFDNIGAFELEEYYNREMVQRQMHDLISSIAKSSDLTFNEVKTISKGIGKISPKFDTGTRVDMGEARAELEEAGEDAERERLKKLGRGKGAFVESLGEPSVSHFSIGSESGEESETEKAIRVFKEEQKKIVLTDEELDIYETRIYNQPKDDKVLTELEYNVLQLIATRKGISLNYKNSSGLMVDKNKEQLINAIIGHDKPKAKKSEHLKEK